VVIRSGPKGTGCAMAGGVAAKRSRWVLRDLLWGGDGRPNGEWRCAYLGKNYTGDMQIWQDVPDPGMTSYHRGHTAEGILASAFVVTSIERRNEAIERPLGWYRTKDGRWETTIPVPTRGEYLTRAPVVGGRTKVRLMLQVRAPFVVWVR